MKDVFELLVCLVLVFFLGFITGKAFGEPFSRQGGKWVWMEQIVPSPEPAKLYRYPDGYVGPIPTPRP